MKVDFTALLEEIEKLGDECFWLNAKLDKLALTLILAQEKIDDNEVE